MADKELEEFLGDIPCTPESLRELELDFDIEKFVDLEINSNPPSVSQLGELFPNIVVNSQEVIQGPSQPPRIPQPPIGRKSIKICAKKKKPGKYQRKYIRDNRIKTQFDHPRGELCLMKRYEIYNRIKFNVYNGQESLIRFIWQRFPKKTIEDKKLIREIREQIKERSDSTVLIAKYELNLI